MSHLTFLFIKPKFISQNNVAQAGFNVMYFFLKRLEIEQYCNAFSTHKIKFFSHLPIEKLS